MDREFIESLKKTKRFEISMADISNIDANFIKNLRNSFNMSQNVFSLALNISKKTLETWEEGKIRVKGPAALLLYLLDKDFHIMDYIYSYKFVNFENCAKINEFRNIQTEFKGKHNVINDFKQKNTSNSNIKQELNFAC